MKETDVDDTRWKRIEKEQKNEEIKKEKEAAKENWKVENRLDKKALG